MISRRRAARFLCLIAAAFLLSGPLHAQSTERAKRLGGQLMCMCGCNQILTQCNHVGCTVSASMLKSLDQRVAAGGSDDLILQSFVQEFGTKALALPPAQGFNLLAWLIPGVAFALGLVLVVAVIRQWRRRVILAPAGGPPLPPDMMERARRQIERETED